MPLMQLSTLVLPAPFGPISASSSPGAREKETPSSTGRPPKRRDRFSTGSSAIPPPRPAVLLDVAIATALTGCLPEVEFLHVLVALEALAAAIQHDTAVLHHVSVIGEIERHRRALLDE